MKILWKSLTPNQSRQNGLLSVARLLALLFMLFLVGIFIIGVVEYPLFAADHPERFTSWNWTPQEVDLIWERMGLSFQWWIQWNRASSIGFAIIISAIGFFLWVRKGGDWFGLYLATSFVLFGTLNGYMANIVAANHPGLEPLLTPLGVFAWLSFFLVLYIFPNGHFVPRWTRWVAALNVLGFGVDIIFYQGNTPPPFLLLPMLTLIGLGPVSQVYRYLKVSNLLERQQTRLVILAMILVVTLLLCETIPLFAPESIDPASPVAPMMAILNAISQIIVGLIPLSIALAIFRYRLWDIDLVIRRTLVYGLLTFSLGLVYFGGVTLLQQVFTTITGTQSPLAVVLSTLLIFFLFTPLRRGLQAFIDRRFFRRRYDSEQVLRNFGERTRTQANLAEISNQLLETVTEAVEPQGIHLWLPAARFRSTVPGLRPGKEEK